MHAIRLAVTAAGRWLRSVGPERAHLRADLVAGLPGAISRVPDGMAAAVLAGVNPVQGLYASFAGPIVGAVVFNYLKTFAVGYTVYWQMFLGVVLVTLVMALPTGIMGMAARLGQKWRRAPAS